MLTYIALGFSVVSLLTALAALGEAYAKRPAPRVLKLTEEVHEARDHLDRLESRFRKLQMRYAALLRNTQPEQGEEELPRSGGSEFERRNGEAVEEWRKRVMLALGPIRR